MRQQLSRAHAHIQQLKVTVRSQHEEIHELNTKIQEEPPSLHVQNLDHQSLLAENQRLHSILHDLRMKHNRLLKRHKEDTEEIKTLGRALKRAKSMLHFGGITNAEPSDAPEAPQESPVSLKEAFFARDDAAELKELKPPSLKDPEVDPAATQQGASPSPRAMELVAAPQGQVLEKARKGPPPPDVTRGASSGLYFLVHDFSMSVSHCMDPPPGVSYDEEDVVRGPFAPGDPKIPKDSSYSSSNYDNDTEYESSTKVLKQCTAGSLAEAKYKLGVGPPPAAATGNVGRGILKAAISSISHI